MEQEDNIKPSEPFADLEERMRAAAEASSEMEKRIAIESPEMLNVETPSFEPPKSKVKKTKGEIIEKILQLQTQLKIKEPKPESYFKKISREDCEKILAGLVDKGADKVQGVAPKGKFSKDWGAKGLFQFNLILCKVAELGSANFKEKLGTDLIGLCDDVQANRQELTEILAEIYEEHGESIGSYLSPLNRYFLLMSTLGANRALVNKKRVDAELEKN